MILGSVYCLKWIFEKIVSQEKNLYNTKIDITK